MGSSRSRPLSREERYAQVLKKAGLWFNLKTFWRACPRSKLEDFELLSLLGYGTYGTVYKARRKTQGNAQSVSRNPEDEPEPEENFVAIKVQEKAKIVEANVVEMIIREKKFQWGLESNYTVPLFSAFQDDANVYMVMEYARRGSLDAHIIPRRGLPHDVVQLHAAMIVMGLEYLHACNLLHRDVSPENVFVYEDGYVKLGDYGCIVEQSAFISGAAGNFSHLAPEVFLAQQCTDGVDWWAFGVTLYEMYTAEWVFGDAGEAARMEELILEASPVIDCEKVPKRAQLFIARLLERDITKRIGTDLLGVRSIKSHSYFTNFNFYDLHDKQGYRVNRRFLTEQQFPDVTEDDMPRKEKTNKYAYQFRKF